MKKIGLIEAYAGNFDKNNFYNSQIVGLAKALHKNKFEVEIYKFTKAEKNSVYLINNSIKYYTIASISIYNTSFISTKSLSRDLDAIVFFSGISINLSKLEKWCAKNNVILFPYIGITESNSNKTLIRKITNIFYKRSIFIYKRHICFAKTESVLKELLDKEVKNVELLPVGLDEDLLNKEFNNYDKNEIKKKYGFIVSDEILLFIGRLEKEKNPINIVEIFRILNSQNNKYKLIIIGKGNEKNQLLTKLKEYKLLDKTLYIDEIENSKIWELYYISNWFINLSTTEIFGMCILEALFYNCHVIAMNAPGPRMIIENGFGDIVNNNNEIIDIIENNEILQKTPNQLINEKYVWNKTIKNLLKYL